VSLSFFQEIITSGWFKHHSVSADCVRSGRRFGEDADAFGIAEAMPRYESHHDGSVQCTLPYIRRKASRLLSAREGRRPGVTDFSYQPST
jgi:hypothetical protein